MLNKSPSVQEFCQQTYLKELSSGLGVLGAFSIKRSPPASAVMKAADFGSYIDGLIVMAPRSSRACYLLWANRVMPCLNNCEVCTANCSLWLYRNPEINWEKQRCGLLWAVCHRSHWNGRRSSITQTMHRPLSGIIWETRSCNASDARFDTRSTH